MPTVHSFSGAEMATSFLVFPHWGKTAGLQLHHALLYRYATANEQSIERVEMLLDASQRNTKL